MSLESVWPYFVLMTLVMTVVGLPLFRALDGGEGGEGGDRGADRGGGAAGRPGGRHASIDGLRGFLALGVFVFHLVITDGYLRTGLWQAPQAGFHALLGPVGVSLFFMITGFLFWAKLLRVQGRPDWRALFVGRLFRIGPMYLAVVLAMLAIVFWRSGATLREPGWQVAGAVAQWLALGLVDHQPTVNGQDARHVLAGVTWTLAYEWAFYASLPLTAVFVRGRWHHGHRWHLAFVAAALLACLAGKAVLGSEAMGFAALFLYGMGVASLLHGRQLGALSDRWLSTLAVGCLVLIFGLSRSGYGSLNALLLALFFYGVCAGASLFGLLTSTPARRLGHISYSLYLLQGLVLTLVFAVEPLRRLAATSAAAHWAVGAVCALLLLALAALTWRGIERPGIAWGRRLVKPLPPRPTAWARALT